MSFSKNLTITVKNTDAQLNEPLYVYEKDRNLIVYFKIMDYKYKFDKNPTNVLASVDDIMEAYATIVDPNGYELTRQYGEVIEDEIKFIVTNDLVDELDELGTYRLQFHIKCQHSEFTIPEISFEVLERLKGFRTITDEGEVGDEILNNSESFIDEEGKLHLVWREGDTISSVRLNQMVQVINNAVDEEHQRQINEVNRENRANAKLNELETRFSALTTSQQQSAEVIDARDGEASLKARLDRDVNTHTEQISNLNKELDRVKKLEESTVSTVETESDFTTVEATSNGYFEDVKLEGKTLVNLCPKPNAYAGDGDIENRVVISGNVVELSLKEGYYTGVNFTSNSSLMKPNTTYTIVANILENTMTKGNLAIIEGNPDTSFTGVNIPLGYKGVFVIKATTRSSYILPRIQSMTTTTCKTGEKVKFSLMVLEGDHTQNPPSYFEGLKSVGQDVDEIEVSSANENLLNLVDLGCTNLGGHLTIEYMNSNNIKLNTLSTNTNKYISASFDTFKFIPNVRYKIKAKYTHSDSANAPFISVRKYGNNGVALKDIYGKNGVIEDTFVPTHAKHRIDFFAGNQQGSLGGTWVEFTDIQISIDNDDFSYFTPYQADKKRLLYYNEETQTWEKPILREWDSIEKHTDGKYYYHQRSGEVVLNGSEDWSDFSTINGVGKTYTFAIKNKAYGFDNLVCDKLPVTSTFASDATILNGISGTNSNNAIWVSINASITDAQGFKQWLQANNVTVVYQLSEEKVYECTNIDLITYANETNYIVESGAIVPKSTLKVHNNIANVISVLKKKVSVLESNYVTLFNTITAAFNSLE